MNFLILREFSRIFRIYFRFLRIKKNLKRLKRGVNFRAGPTWVRRGTQGHVAKPRGPTRAPAWRGGDTWLLFIFIIYRIYNIYRSSDYRKTNYYPSYPPYLLNRIVSLIFTVWDYVPRFVLNAGDVDQCEASDQRRDD